MSQRVNVAPGTGANIVGAEVVLSERNGAPVHFERGDVILATSQGIGRVVGWTPTPGGTSDFAPPSAIVELDAAVLDRPTTLRFPPRSFDRPHVAVWAYNERLHELYPELPRLPAAPVLARRQRGVAVLVNEREVPRVRLLWAIASFTAAIEAALDRRAESCILHAEVSFSMGEALTPAGFALLMYAYRMDRDDGRSDHVLAMARRVQSEADFAARTEEAYKELLATLPTLPS